MAYDRTIIVFQSWATAGNGETPDESNYTNGKITDCLAARFKLAPEGGCLGGEIVLPGTVRDPFLISENQYIRMYYRTADEPGESGVGSPVYSALVKRGGRHVEPGSGHHYELESLWQRIEAADNSSAALLGDADGCIGDDTNTTSKAVKWLLANRLNSISQIASTESQIETSTVAVNELRLHESQNIGWALRQLAIMASSEGAPWIVGIDAQDRLFFQALPTSTAATLTIGETLQSANEQSNPPSYANRLHVQGALIPRGDQAGRPASQRTDNSGSEVPQPWRRLRTGLTHNADMTAAATGYFERHGQTGTELGSARQQHSAATAPTPPWSGRAAYTDTQRGDLDTGVIQSVDVDLGDVYTFTATVSQNLRERAEDVVSSMAGPGAPSDVEDGVSDCDIDNPPDRDDPRMITDEELSAGVGSIERGTVLMFLASGGAVKDDTVHVIALVANGGSALDSDALSAMYALYDDGGTERASGSGVGMVCDDNTIGNIEIWKTSIGISASYAGTIYYGVKTDIDGVEYWPADPTSSKDDCPTVRVLGTATNQTVGTIYEIPTGWASE